MMNLLRRMWADVLVVVGAMWLAYSCSAYSGYGNVDGQVDGGSGEVSGDISISYSDGERLQIMCATAAVAIGALAKVNKR